MASLRPLLVGLLGVAAQARTTITASADKVNDVEGIKVQLYFDACDIDGDDVEDAITASSGFIIDKISCDDRSSTNDQVYDCEVDLETTMTLPATVKLSHSSGASVDVEVLGQVEGELTSPAFSVGSVLTVTYTANQPFTYGSLPIKAENDEGSDLNVLDFTHNGNMLTVNFHAPEESTVTASLRGDRLINMAGVVGGKDDETVTLVTDQAACKYKDWSDWSKCPTECRSPTEDEVKAETYEAPKQTRKRKLSKDSPDDCREEITMQEMSCAPEFCEKTIKYLDENDITGFYSFPMAGEHDGQCKKRKKIKEGKSRCKATNPFKPFSGKKYKGVESNGCGCTPDCEKDGNCCQSYWANDCCEGGDCASPTVDVSKLPTCSCEDMESSDAVFWHEGKTSEKHILEDADHYQCYCDSQCERENSCCGGVEAYSNAISKCFK